MDSTWINNSLSFDLNSNPRRLHDSNQNKELHGDFIDIGLNMGSNQSASKQASVLIEELNRVGEENKRLTEKLTVMCENYNTLQGYVVNFLKNSLEVQYSTDDLQGKAENKDALRKLLKLSSADSMKPLVGCITRLVPQKGVHLIRHAIYRTLELGGQFVLLGSSPVPHIQKEFEVIANHFQTDPHIRLILKYDEVLSHSIYAASDMFIIPSIFEPCGLTQMIAMRYGSIPIARKTGGLNDSVFDVDDDTIPLQFRNGFTFLSPDEQGMNSALERAFSYYMKHNESWQKLVEKNMKIDFSWDSSAEQYVELYQNTVARAKAAKRA